MKEHTSNLPTFSIVFETENLSSVELDNIYQSLASLESQNIPISHAKEFLIIDGGYAPENVIAELSAKYPWINVRRMPGIGYHEAKMTGASLATGDIVVFCDSDCIYASNWLSSILTTFLQSSNINVVAGETSTPVRNAYELAIAMHYFFPRFSRQKDPYESHSYFLNCVAFRRDFLLQNPIPTDLPLYRSNCQIHIHYLCTLKGYTIWKHPQAQAVHEPPTISFITWRYLLRGRDRVLREFIKRDLTTSEIIKDFKFSDQLNLTLHQKFSMVSQTLRQARVFNLHQVITVLREDPWRIFLVPIALPLMVWFEIVYTLGSAITYFRPNFLLKLYKQVESEMSVPVSTV